MSPPIAEHSPFASSRRRRRRWSVLSVSLPRDLVLQLEALYTAEDEDEFQRVLDDQTRRDMRHRRAHESWWSRHGVPPEEPCPTLRLAAGSRLGRSDDMAMRLGVCKGRIVSRIVLADARANREPIEVPSLPPIDRRKGTRFVRFGASIPVADREAVVWRAGVLTCSEYVAVVLRQAIDAAVAS
jgi:hypothetical protein